MRELLRREAVLYIHFKACTDIAISFTKAISALAKFAKFAVVWYL